MNRFRVMTVPWMGTAGWAPHDNVPPSCPIPVCAGGHGTTHIWNQGANSGPKMAERGIKKRV